ncbi:Wzz/FepE/Etk N-terminal domain-containing protein [Aliivibrio sp. S3MY1]|uniref:Wzz/FepE/Etk N-terminal domain-containing protein n=1 Tax=unclassified Aliivibrio TaxID=2645654 RepID=UPI002378E897|nr:MULTISPECIES: Wzz/FepE/Etk N-terminal domain-containing protein [unclassified Aliivibrio]MDD9196691.1 Wzz/FepE/Etk N-terminal domain-containing protein [Aliivibrio sp. S3MY1]MDD9199818.1 Wzz/FepE/Etk N-terminal domain-containing protein [Aliivibrio sp. S2MY1]
MNNQSPQQFQQYPQPPSFQNDEIDLKELFMALWAGKLWIIGLTVLFAAGATVFALSQPNVYETKAVLVVNPDPYGIIEGLGGAVGNHMVPKTNLELPKISAQSMKDSISSLAQSNKSTLNGLSISAKGSSIFVSQQGHNSDDIYQNVQLFTQYVNQAYKQGELVNIDLELVATKELLAQNQIEKVQDVLAEKYAQQLYKITLLKNPNTELVQVIQQPVKAASHIKPKRALIIVLGTLLGGMLGAAVVLVRFAFRKEELEIRN